MTQQLDVFLETIKDKISDSERKRINLSFKKRLWKKNEFIHSTGKICKFIFFIEKGSVRIFSTENGRESTRHIAFEGSAVTDLISFTNQISSNEFIQATEDVELLCMSYEDFQNLYTSIPSLKELYVKRLEMAYYHNIKRLETFITMNAKERFQYLMETSPEIIHRISNVIVANYLGMTPESLSRLKSKKK